MAVYVELPQMTDTMTGGVLIRKIVAEGDSVAVGDPIAEIETDKAVMELEAPSAGVLRKWFFTENDEVACGAHVAIIGSVDEAIDVHSVESSDVHTTHDTAVDERVKASPLARKIARESEIDLTEITGTGPNGRIVQRDVDAATAKRRSPTAEESVKATHVTPISRSRRIMIDRLTHTVRNVPTFSVTHQFDVEQLVSLLKQHREIHEDGVRVGVTEVLVKASALAMNQVPTLNARFTAHGIESVREVNIGVAIGLDDHVVAPVVHSCEEKSLVTITRELHEKVERAKRGALLADDLQGSTFTLSNLGMFGINEFHAILNAPDAAIFAVGAISKQPVVKNDSLAIGTVLTGTLTVDHRIADGIVAAKWVAAFADVLANPLQLFL